MQVVDRAFEPIAQADPERLWELHRGVLREKPGMAAEHNDGAFLLAHLLQGQLDRRVYRLRVNGGHVRIASNSFYIPDVSVVPVEMTRPQTSQPGRLEVYADPLPLVVEVWSKSTGGYDVESKLPEYQTRGDAEIWRMHPYERTLTIWRRLPDGTYDRTVHRHGVVTVSSLPGVALDLDAFFADLDLASVSGDARL